MKKKKKTDPRLQNGDRNALQQFATLTPYHPAYPSSYSYYEVELHCSKHFFKVSKAAIPLLGITLRSVFVVSFSPIKAVWKSENYRQRS